MPSYIVAISGPTAAGKTYFTKHLLRQVQEAGLTTVKISTDEFYHDLSDLTMAERIKVNYDQPDSIDSRAFKNVLATLASGGAAEVPVYDFTTHTRTEEIRIVEPADLIIVEGIFSLSFPEINDIYNLKIFINLDQDLRLIRRVRRDMKERGRNLESVFKQYVSQVRPAQDDFVRRDLNKADMILLGNKDHSKVYKLIVAGITQHAIN